MMALLWAFVGGLFGALLMDLTEQRLDRLGIRSGVSVALVGRWALWLLRGRLYHPEIRATPPLPGEVRAGWIFHLLIGGGVVGALYPLPFLLLGQPLPSNHLLGGLLYGLATSLLPWLILLPAFGWGLGGRRGPSGSNALLASPLSHLPYGLGVGLLLTLGGV